MHFYQMHPGLTTFSERFYRKIANDETIKTWKQKLGTMAPVSGTMLSTMPKRSVPNVKMRAKWEKYDGVRTTSEKDSGLFRVYRKFFGYVEYELLIMCIKAYTMCIIYIHVL